MQKKLKIGKGFTLIELIVVMAVIAILVLLATPRFLNYTVEARETKIKHDRRIVENTIEEYLVIHDELPESWEDKDEVELDKDLDDKKVHNGEKQVDEVVGGPFKIVDKDFVKAKTNSKLEGEFIVDSDGNTYYIHDKPLAQVAKEDGGNEVDKIAEIDMLIKTGWIPVANADELNQIREDDEVLTFGAGTQWEGLYVSGHDKNFIQVENIDMSSYPDWEPIGYSEFFYDDKYGFSGDYNGMNYIISNLTVTLNYYTEYSVGLFGYTNNNEIKNVILSKPRVTGGYMVGALIGYGEETTLTGITINEAEINVGGIMGGAIAGHINSSSALPNRDLWVDGNINFIDENADCVGGAFGKLEASVVNGYANVNIDTLDGVIVDNSSGGAGGFAGSAEGNHTLTDIRTDGNIKGKTAVGGAFGFIGEGITVEDSYSGANVEGYISIGGFAGQIGDNSMVRNSNSAGNIVGEYNTGGFVGWLLGNSTVEDSFATGNVSGDKYIGGFAGEVNEGTLLRVSGSSNIIANDFFGIIVGELSDYGKLHYSIGAHLAEAMEKQFAQGLTDAERNAFRAEFEALRDSYVGKFGSYYEHLDINYQISYLD